MESRARRTVEGAVPPRQNREFEGVSVSPSVEVSMAELAGFVSDGGQTEYVRYVHGDFALTPGGMQDGGSTGNES